MLSELHLNKMYGMSFRQVSEYSVKNCLEEKVVLVDELARFPFGSESEGIIAADFIALLFCTRGQLDVNMDGRKHTLGKGDILFCSQGATLHGCEISTSCQGKVLCLSWEYGQTLFLRSTCQWNCILRLRHNPLLQLDVGERNLYRAYYQLFAEKLHCHSEACDMDCIFQSFFYDLYRMTERCIVQKPEQWSYRTSIRQEEIFKRFITLLKETQKHSCAYYAQQLCITPKHLTTVVKKVSGKSVSQWIDFYLMDRILFYLKTTNMTISEISDKMNFSNASFFGKYVKMQTGESPTKLRRA
ncbi:MAG: helix-turn-helix domain-containing protein [Bacteroidaceae bacterium]